MEPIDRRSLLAGSLALAAPFLQDKPFLQEKAKDEPREDVSQLGRTPHTRFAVNLEMWWTQHDFLQRIALASQLGFPAIEFWSWRDKDIAAIQDVTADLGLEIAQIVGWGFQPGMNDPRSLPAFEREIKEACEVARRLKCKKMTVLAGNDLAGASREEMHENITRALKKAAPIAESADVMLILEPLNTRVDHAGYCLSYSADAVKICRAVGSTHVKINWDLYHLQITEGDLCGRMKEGFDQLGYVQIADHPGRHEPGTGEIHYPRVLRELHDLGYRGCVGLELTPRDDATAAARRVNAADQW